MNFNENRSPESYRKPSFQSNVPSYSETPLGNSGAEIAKRQLMVDSLHPNREKKWFFDKVEYDGEYFPYGAPGSGAPLRDPSNNQLISRLPKLEKNLWKKVDHVSEKPMYEPNLNKTTYQSNYSHEQKPADAKRNEIHKFIDNFSRNPDYPTESNVFDNYQLNNNQNYPRKNRSNSNSNLALASRKYEPEHKTGSNYWNDWFGKPGGGAPNPAVRKQNLDEMLEPQRNLFQAQYVPSQYEPSSSMGSPRRIRSNHHTMYEPVPL